MKAGKPMKRTAIKPKNRYASADARTRRVMLDKYGDKCFRCGCAGVEVSHLWRRGLPSQRHNDLNLTLMCHDCHVWWGQESTKQERMDWLEANYPKRYQHYMDYKKGKV